MSSRSSRVATLPAVIAELALLSLTDESAIHVLGDAVQEAEWFDPRVMQLLWPVGKAKRNGERTVEKRRRRALDKENWKAGFREFFVAFSAKPTLHWARAIAAVVIFGTWQKRRGPSCGGHAGPSTRPRASPSTACPSVSSPTRATARADRRPFDDSLTERQ